MLLLSRRPGQEIFIGDDIVLTVDHIDSRKHYARILIEAPQHLAVRWQGDRLKPVPTDDDTYTATYRINAFDRDVFLIGDEITLMQAGIRKRSQVRIGIEAPRHISVCRDDVKTVPSGNERAV